VIFLEKTLKIAGFAQFRPVFAGFATLGQFWPVLAGHFLASSGWPIFISSSRLRPFSAGLADFGRPWLVNFSPGRIQPVLTGPGQSSWP
jgi:hypothetical protein